MNKILIGDDWRLIPVDELPAAPELHEPDSTVARQCAIRRLIRLLDRERRACICVETFAQEFAHFRTMQAAGRLNNAEAQLRSAGEAVATAWTQYRTLDTHPASIEQQDSGEAGALHGERI